MGWAGDTVRSYWPLGWHVMGICNSANVGSSSVLISLPQRQPKDQLQLPSVHTEEREKLTRLYSPPIPVTEKETHSTFLNWTDVILKSDKTGDTRQLHRFIELWVCQKRSRVQRSNRRKRRQTRNPKENVSEVATHFEIQYPIRRQLFRNRVNWAKAL